MKRRVAFPLNAADEAADPIRAPRAFSSTETVDAPDLVETWTDAAADPGNVPVPALRRSWLARILWGTASLLVSLGLGLALHGLQFADDGIFIDGHLDGARRGGSGGGRDARDAVLLVGPGRRV